LGGSEDTEGRNVSGFAPVCLVLRKGRKDTYPQKISDREKRSWAKLPPVSADSIPAMTMELKVELNIRNSHRRRNMVPALSVTASVGIAFRWKPIG
jgi:hypothetical protein